MEPTPGIGLTIKRIHGCLHAEASRSFTSIDLTPAQGHFLVVLHHKYADRARMKTMETEFHCAQSTIAGIASRLEKKALIASFPDPGDHRVKWVCLTESGKALCEQSRRSISLAEQKMLSTLTPQEQEVLESLLKRCEAAFEPQTK